jgi:hypothetical protein
VTLERARQRAEALDSKTDGDLTALQLDPRAKSSTK